MSGFSLFFLLFFHCQGYSLFVNRLATAVNFYVLFLKSLCQVRLHCPEYLPLLLLLVVVIFVMLKVHKKHLLFFREGPSSSWCHPYNYAFDSWAGVTSEEPTLLGRVVTFANEEYFTDSELF